MQLAEGGGLSVSVRCLVSEGTWAPFSDEESNLTGDRYIYARLAVREASLAVATSSHNHYHLRTSQMQGQNG
jgi:hypothetical protein